METGPRQRIRITESKVSALGIRALTMVALSVTLIVADYRGVGLSTIRNLMSLSVTPLQWFVQIPSLLFGSISDQWVTREQLIKDNEHLKAALIERDSGLLRFNAVKAENDRLRDLLGIKHEPTPKEIGAQVLDVTQDHLRQRVLIDQGSNAGLERDQPVVDRGGVYGQTVSVGPTTTEVILLSDAGHALPIIIERTGLRSIAVGTGDPNELVIPYLPRNTDVEKNDRILTSGLGGVFPSGLPVGTVREVKRDPSQPLARIIIEPAAQMDRSHEVLVLQAAPMPKETPPTNPSVNGTNPATPSAPLNPNNANAAAAPASGNSANHTSGTSKPAKETSTPNNNAQPNPSLKLEHAHSSSSDAHPAGAAR